MSYELRSYAGGAPETALAIDMTAGAGSFAVTTGDGASYPDGTGGDYFAIIDYDKAGSAEKVLIASRSGDTFTVATRGVDGTVGTSHSAGAKVRLVWTGTEALEANRAAHYTVGQVTSKGDLLVGTGANTLARLPAGIPGQTLTPNPAAAGGVDWESFDAAPAGAWITYTPVITSNGVQATPDFPGDLTAAYKVFGKTLFWRLNTEHGITSAQTAEWRFYLPAPSGVQLTGSTNAPQQIVPTYFRLGSPPSGFPVNQGAPQYLFADSAYITLEMYSDTSTAGPAAPAQALSFVSLQGVIEIN